LAEKIFGWNRQSVQTGLGEKRTGIICGGAQPAFAGNRRWEERYPEMALALRQLAEENAQADPTFRTFLAYLRLTAQEALKQLRAQGFSEAQLPSKSSMAEILNRMGYRLRKVVKAKPPKKIPETDAIFENLKEKEAEAKSAPNVKRLIIDCKATVKIGNYSRGGKTRGENKADDHDMGCIETYTPFGILEEDSGQLHISFGNSYKTSDFIVVSGEWWNGLSGENQQDTTLIQIKVDNGPESSGVRTQFLKRMTDFAETIRSLSICYIIRHIIVNITQLNAAGKF